jgi:hypothetical protein
MELLQRLLSSRDVRAIISFVAEFRLLCLADQEAVVAATKFPESLFLKGLEKAEHEELVAQVKWLTLARKLHFPVSLTTADNILRGSSNKDAQAALLLENVDAHYDSHIERFCERLPFLSFFSFFSYFLFFFSFF